MTSTPRRRSSRPPIVRPVLVGAVVALLLAACGDGGDDGGGDEAGGEAGGEGTPGTVPGASADDLSDGDGSSGAATAATPLPPPSTTAPPSPSPDADLPAAAPGATTVPPTTSPGPLTPPDVDLFEVTRLERPTGLAVRPADDRAFVLEQPGRVVAVAGLSTEVVLDITDRVEDGSNEQGLLGLAFHPEGELAYVNYTGSGGDTVVAEFAVDPRTAVFDPDSERVVMTVDQPFPNHNGGQLTFGPDGYLYIGLGDGGSAGDPQRAGLDLSTRLGKILRIDPRAAGDDPFSVPDDNPFLGRDGADPTIWSFGLRNPWKFAFDAANGDLWIADVGQNAFEEVNRAPATDGRDAGRGLSFGWSAFEANTRFNEDQRARGHTAPTIVYPHDGGNCSVTGGLVVRDAVVPDLDGWYLYGDYCSGTIWGYDTTSSPADPTIVELAALPSVSAIAAGPLGDVYAVANDGRVMLVVPA